tara:strand:- start:14256 stop:14555 length:300 start_codon:yes stop_codon:yes gene_type:complete
MKQTLEETIKEEKNTNYKPKFVGSCTRITKRTVEVVAAYNFFNGDLIKAAEFLKVSTKTVSNYVNKYNFLIEQQDIKNKTYNEELDEFEKELKESTAEL